MNDNVTPIAGHNGIDQKALEGFISRAENVDAEIDKIMAEAKEKCQPFRDDLKVIKNEAADDGFPKKSFAAALKHRRLKRKADTAGDKLNEGLKNDYEQMLFALGDLAETPLGQAALN